MGRWAFLTLIQGFLAGGLHTSADRIVQVPRVEVTAPNDLTDLSDPSSILVEWDTEWKRWDGRAYTTSYSSSFSESAAVSYSVIYSDDNGQSWKYCSDDSTAVPGKRPSSSYLQTGSSYSWSTPASEFPKGTYLVRVEAYRDDKELHYAYHQRRIFIKR
jgi:hypothetical protein